MTYPILEYDSTQNAFIEPSKVIKPRNMPEHCVICIFREVIDKVIAEHNAKMLVENRWEDGPHPVYEISYQNQQLAFFHPGVGAPLAAGLLEEVIAFGCRKFIACGGCGVLEKDMTVGSLIVVSGAIRDEGVSYHYLPPDREVIANEVGVNALVKALSHRGVPYRVGKTWTTDAPCRETPNKIAERKKEGCLAVEMESAGMMAVAQFRGVVFGLVLYSGDDLSGTEWDNRAWQSRDEIRESLFWLCADCVNRKSEDDHAQVVYKDYVNTAKQLEREISSTFHAWKVIKGWVIAFLISGFAFQIFYAVAPINKYRSKDLNAGMVIVSLIIVVSAYGIPITWVSKRNKWIREHEEIRAAEIEKPKSGFQEFYVTWKKEKSKEQLMTALAPENKRCASPFCFFDLYQFHRALGA